MKTIFNTVISICCVLTLCSCEKNNRKGILGSPPYNSDLGMITEYIGDSLIVLTDKYVKYLVTNIEDVRSSERNFKVNDRIALLGLKRNKRLEKDTLIYDFEIAVISKLEMDVIAIGDVVMKNSVNEEDLLNKFGSWNFMSYSHNISDKYYTAKYTWYPTGEESKHKITFIINNTDGEPTINDLGELVLDVEVYINMLDGEEGGPNGLLKNNWVSLPIEQYTKMSGLNKLILNVKKRNGDTNTINSIIWDREMWDDQRNNEYSMY